MHANMHTCKHAYITAYRSGSLLRYAQENIHAHIHSYTHMHTHTHLYTRTCMHITYRSGSLLRCSLCPVPRRCKYHCVYMYICAYTCVLVCVCARTSMCAFTSSRIHWQTSAFCTNWTHTFEERDLPTSLQLSRTHSQTQFSLHAILSHKLLILSLLHSCRWVRQHDGVFPNAPPS